MDDENALKRRIKELMVENLMLQISADEIKDDQLLFGPGSLGLDSVDALQLVVALDKNYGLKIPTPADAKVILQSVNTIAAAIQAKSGQSPA
jgi:acyl carrier protein